MECAKTCAIKLKSVSGSRYRQIGIFEQFVLSLNVCIDAKKKNNTWQKTCVYTPGNCSQDRQGTKIKTNIQTKGVSFHYFKTKSADVTAAVK